MYKFIAVVASLAALAMALPHKPVAESEHHEHKEADHHPQYKFEYGVKDGHTGDHKTQWEHRDGDHVKGQYTLEEANGGHRVVDYESDAHGGIQIQVKTVGGHGPAPKVHEPVPVVPVKSSKTAHHHGGESYANLKKHRH